MSRVLLVRHGRTAWHAEGRYAGTADVPLDDVGIEQAERVVEGLEGRGLGAVYSSPLSRCLVMAERVAASHGLQVIVDERLREIDLGRWDGVLVKEIIEKDGEILKQWTTDPASVTVPGGESLAEVQKRAMLWLEEAAAAHHDGTIAACSHGGPIRAILASVIGLPLSKAFRLATDLASISTVDFKGEFSNLEGLNDRHHLEGMKGGHSAFR